jgi:hypothetical protein
MLRAVAILRPAARASALIKTDEHGSTSIASTKYFGSLGIAVIVSQ